MVGRTHLQRESTVPPHAIPCPGATVSLPPSIFPEAYIGLYVLAEFLRLGFGEPHHGRTSAFLIPFQEKMDIHGQSSGRFQNGFNGLDPGKQRAFVIRYATAVQIAIPFHHLIRCPRNPFLQVPRFHYIIVIIEKDCPIRLSRHMPANQCISVRDRNPFRGDPCLLEPFFNECPGFFPFFRAGSCTAIADELLQFPEVFILMRIDIGLNLL